VQPSTQKKPQNQATQLVGHQGEIYTLQFSHDGEYIASAGFDRQIFFWEVFPISANPGDEN
jgi:Prp8 binding protein